MCSDFDINFTPNDDSHVNRCPFCDSYCYTIRLIFTVINSKINKNLYNLFTVLGHFKQRLKADA